MSEASGCVPLGAAVLAASGKNPVIAAEEGDNNCARLVIWVPCKGSERTWSTVTGCLVVTRNPETSHRLPWQIGVSRSDGWLKQIDWSFHN